MSALCDRDVSMMPASYQVRNYEEVAECVPLSAWPDLSPTRSPHRVLDFHAASLLLSERRNGRSILTVGPVVSRFPTPQFATIL